MSILPDALPQCLEAGMLVCFGVSWPVDIIKSLRVRRIEGKSLSFMVIILAGYALGMTGKLLTASAAEAPLEWVTVLYGVNLLFVAADITLYVRISRSAAAQLSPRTRDDLKV
ncbi:MAG: hypothetical protein J7M14_07570 [Planctomycetes bacterium]|nr:hypothetical protein [Planctomycetota bacterium]